jgi:hypothetical protein
MISRRYCGSILIKARGLRTCTDVIQLLALLYDWQHFFFIIHVIQSAQGSGRGSHASETFAGVYQLLRSHTAAFQQAIIKET